MSLHVLSKLSLSLPAAEVERHTFFPSFIHLIILIMANDYDLEATELLETYGTCLWSSYTFGTTAPLPDFLMKYIIIGMPLTATHPKF